MAKGEDDVKTRLQQAALHLFHERGYDRTTAAEIAAHAGVTERTFFRHFLDKREALFHGEATLKAAMTTLVRDAPAGPGPLDTLHAVFGSLQPILEANRSFASRRRQVVSATPALHERELAKTAALCDAVAAALTARGVNRPRAALASQAGMAAFMQAVLSWLDEPGANFGETLEAAFQELKSLLA